MGIWEEANNGVEFWRRVVNQKRSSKEFRVWFCRRLGERWNWSRKKRGLKVDLLIFDKFWFNWMDSKMIAIKKELVRKVRYKKKLLKFNRLKINYIDLPKYRVVLLYFRLIASHSCFRTFLLSLLTFFLFQKLKLQQHRCMVISWSNKFI